MDLIDRRDVDQYLKAWKDAHASGLPLIVGCRARWPNGMILQARCVGRPKISNRQMLGLDGISTFKQIA